MWLAPLVEIDFAIGGKIRSNYNPNGKIGDATTIENTILSFDPKRMISLRPTKFPVGFPFVEAAKKEWTVFYFQKISSTRTKVTLVGLGYTDDEQSRKLREFFYCRQQIFDRQAESGLGEKVIPARLECPLRFWAVISDL